MRFDEDKIYSTLGERSQDDTGYRFIESVQKVIDFDEITKEIADKYRNKRPMASCDALYFKDKNHIYLIEFKNARRSYIGKNFFLQKAYDSALTVNYAFLQSLSLEQIRERLYLIIVFNDDSVKEKEQNSENFRKIKKTFESLAGYKNRVLFGLDIYKGILYKDVLTIDKDFFMEQVYKEIF